MNSLQKLLSKIFVHGKMFKRFVQIQSLSLNVISRDRLDVPLEREGRKPNRNVEEYRFGIFFHKILPKKYVWLLKMLTFGNAMTANRLHQFGLELLVCLCLYPWKI